MNQGGPIIIIEDDLDDQELLGEAFKQLNVMNEVIFFSDSYKALDYLVTTHIKPFIIFSDNLVMFSFVGGYFAATAL